MYEETATRAVSVDLCPYVYSFCYFEHIATYGTCNLY